MLARDLHEDNRQSWNSATKAHNSGMAEIIGALRSAGLTMDVFREYPWSNGAMLRDGMRALPGRRFLPPAELPSFPLMFGIRALR
jgi:hypothetical protein